MTVVRLGTKDGLIEISFLAETHQSEAIRRLVDEKDVESVVMEVKGLTIVLHAPHRNSYISIVEAV